MRILRILGYYCIILVFPVQIDAQENVSGFFKNYTIDDGLPANSIEDIVEDHHGVIWLATNNGLCSFDGYTFKSFHYNLFDSTTVSGNRIINLEKAEYPYIWVGTYEGGLSKFNTLTGKSIRIPFGVKNPAIKDERIITLHTDKFGVTWIGSSNNFLSFILPGSLTAQKVHLKHPERLQADTIYSPEIAFVKEHPTNDSILIITVKNYILFMNRITFGYKRFEFNPEDGRKTEKPVHYRNVVAFNDTSIWIGGWGCGLIYFNPVKNTWKQYLADTLRPLNNGKNIFYHIAKKDEYSIWISSGGRGFGYFDISTKKFHFYQNETNNSHSIVPGSCNKVYVDKNNGVWAAMSNGLSLWHKENQQFEYLKLPEVKNSTLKNLFTIYATFWDDDRQQLLMGAGEGDGLYILKNGKVKIIPCKQHPIFKVTSILKLNSNTFILSAYGQGVYYFNAVTETITPFKTKEFGNFERYFNMSIALKENKLYVGTWANGFFETDLRTMETLHWSNDMAGDLKPAFKYGFRNLFVDSKKRLWYPMSMGFGCYNPTEKSFYNRLYFDNDSTYPIKFVQDIAEDGNGNIWICTHLQGIFVLDPESFKILRYISYNNGLASGTLYRIKADVRGDIWITSSLGLNYVNHSNYSIKTFNTSNGISNPILSSGFDIVRSNYLALGTFSGIYYANLNQLRKQAYRNSPVLTGFEINDVSKVPQNSFENLVYTDNNISINYSALPYYDPLNMEYSWKLDGLSTGWSEPTSLHEISFYKLKPGSYSFYLKYRLKGEPWSNFFHLVSFTIHPAWWQTIWFKALMVAIIILFCFILYKLRIAYIKRRENLRRDFELQLSKVEMQALRSQMNPHFLFNSLNSIRLFIMKNETEKAADHLTKFSQMVRIILNHSKQELVSVEDELISLKLYVTLEQARFEKQFEYKVTIGEEVDLNGIKIPPMLLQPYIENAIWHGLMHKDGEGVLELKIYYSDNDLIFEIRDNGIGREKSTLLKSKTSLKEKSYGMFITSERMRYFNSVSKNKLEVRVIDEYNNHLPSGTTVIIILKFNSL